MHVPRPRQGGGPPVSRADADGKPAFNILEDRFFVRPVIAAPIQPVASRADVGMA